MSARVTMADTPAALSGATKDNDTEESPRVAAMASVTPNVDTVARLFDLDISGRAFEAAQASPKSEENDVHPALRQQPPVEQKKEQPEEKQSQQGATEAVEAQKPRSALAKGGKWYKKGEAKKLVSGAPEGAPTVRCEVCGHQMPCWACARDRVIEQRRQHHQQAAAAAAVSAARAAAAMAAAGPFGFMPPSMPMYLGDESWEEPDMFHAAMFAAETQGISKTRFRQAKKKASTSVVVAPPPGLEEESALSEKAEDLGAPLSMAVPKSVLEEPSWGWAAMASA